MHHSTQCPFCVATDIGLFEEAAALVAGAAGAAFSARAAVLAPVGVAAALVGAQSVPVERLTAPAYDGVVADHPETKVVPAGEFAALTPGGKSAVSAEAKAAPVEGPSAQKVKGAFAASARQRLVTGLQR